MSRSADNAPSRPRSRRQRLVFSLATALLVYLAVEGLAFAAYAVATGEAFSFSGFEPRRRKAAETPIDAGAAIDAETILDPADWRAGHIPHPFVGFVRSPHAEPWINSHGFYGWEPFAEAGDPGVVQVAVTGGSFAAQMAATTEQRLRAGLEALPAFAGRRVVIVNLAMGGMKQPQQLAALSYFESLGGRYRLVLNIDGYNELVLSAKNAERGIYPHYPGLWHFHLSQLPDLQVQRLIGESSLLGRIRRKLARGLAPVRFSVLANVAWVSVDRYLENRQAKLANQADRRLADRRDGEGDTLPDYIRGPAFDLATGAALYTEVARVWGRASVSINDWLCARGDRYLHALQPNLHLDGTKPLSPEERAAGARSRDRPTVVEGYPYLQREGARLAAAGLPFVDLTTVLAEHPETLYTDGCCHLSAAGYGLVAAAIVAELKARLTDPAPCRVLRPSLG